MRHGFEVEVREAATGRELRGVMIQEGRAASELRELFAPGSIKWPAEGVGVLTEHWGPVETRGQVVRHDDGRLELSAPATAPIRAAVASGKRYLSVEFHSLAETRTRGGIREITRARVDRAALVSDPEYVQAKAEVRSAGRELWRRTCLL